MAKSDIILIDGILKERLGENNIGNQSLYGDELEKLAIEQLLKDFDLSKEELELGHVDGKDDGGIDGIIKEDILGRKALLFGAFELSFEDGVARREPKDAAFGVLLREAEGDERLARARWVDDGGAARLRHEFHGAAIGFLVVRIELERHLPSLECDHLIM